MRIVANFVSLKEKIKLEDLDTTQRYTYADYLTWTFGEMVELIRGRIFSMPPAPNLYHQKISGNLYLKIGNYLKNTPCQLFHAPFDVRLPLPPNKKKNDSEIDTVVQPDICVICDISKLDIRGCLGSPDWIIEILSPGTSRKDLRDKYDIYQHAGVREYWVVHPHEHTLLVFRLNTKGEYESDPRPYVKGDVVRVGIFEDFNIELSEVFSDIEGFG